MSERRYYPIYRAGDRYFVSTMRPMTFIDVARRIFLRKAVGIAVVRSKKYLNAHDTQTLWALSKDSKKDVVCVLFHDDERRSQFPIKSHTARYKDVLKEERFYERIRKEHPPTPSDPFRKDCDWTNISIWNQYTIDKMMQASGFLPKSPDYVEKALHSLIIKPAPPIYVNSSPFLFF